MGVGKSSLDGILGVGLPFFPRLHSLAACWPLVSDAAGRRLTQRPQPAEQGDRLLSPAGDREERVQVRESIVSSGRSGSRKRPRRQAVTGEKMGHQALRVERPWEA